MSKCRSCDAEILWVELASGRRMPLDVASKQTRIVVTNGDRGTVHSATYLSHFATCPNADQHRKPKEPEHV